MVFVCVFFETQTISSANTATSSPPHHQILNNIYSFRTKRKLYQSLHIIQQRFNTKKHDHIMHFL